MAEASEKVKADGPKKRAPTLYFIIVIKLIKGLLALLLAFGVYKLAGKDLGGLSRAWCDSSI